MLTFVHATFVPVTIVAIPEFLWSILEFFQGAIQENFPLQFFPGVNYHLKNNLSWTIFKVIKLKVSLSSD